MHHWHEDFLQEGEDALLVLGHQLVDQRDELLNVVGLYREWKENTYKSRRPLLTVPCTHTYTEKVCKRLSGVLEIFTI